MCEYTYTYIYTYIYIFFYINIYTYMNIYVYICTTKEVHLICGAVFPLLVAADEHASGGCADSLGLTLGFTRNKPCHVLLCLSHLSLPGSHQGSPPFVWGGASALAGTDEHSAGGEDSLGFTPGFTRNKPRDVFLCLSHLSLPGSHQGTPPFVGGSASPLAGAQQPMGCIRVPLIFLCQPRITEVHLLSETSHVMCHCVPLYLCQARTKEVHLLCGAVLPLWPVLMSTLQEARTKSAQQLMVRRAEVNGRPVRLDKHSSTVYVHKSSMNSACRKAKKKGGDRVGPAAHGATPRGQRTTGEAKNSE